MNLNCIIVDDEPGALVVLEHYVQKLPGITLNGKFLNAFDAFGFIKQNRVDILLLDINMPEIDGFGLLDMIAYKPAVIFTTASSDHALRGFDSGAIDYLHKPIRFERFVKAMDKAAKWCSIEYPKKSNDHIELKIEGVMTGLKIADINYIESLGNYIKLHLDNNSFLVLMTMNEIEKKLTANDFVRIHKSYIVNVSKIDRAEHEKVFMSNSTLPVGKVYKKYFEEKIARKITGKQPRAGHS